MSDQSFYETDGRSECSIGGKSRPQAVFSGYWMSLMCIMGDGHSLISYRDEHSSYDQYMNYNFVLFLCSWTHSVGRECSLHAWSWAMLVGLQQTGAGLSMTLVRVGGWVDRSLSSVGSDQNSREGNWWKWSAGSQCSFSQSLTTVNLWTKRITDYRTRFLL